MSGKGNFSLRRPKRKPGNVAPKKRTPTQLVADLRVELAVADTRFGALAEHQAGTQERLEKQEALVEKLLDMLHGAHEQAHDLSMAKAASATLLHTAPDENGVAHNMEQWKAQFEAEAADAENDEEEEGAEALADYQKGFAARHNEVHGAGLSVEEMIKRRKHWEMEQEQTE